MKLYRRTVSVALLAALAVSPAWSGEVLDADEIEFLVTDKTTACLKEKDQSTCTTYFAPEGVMKRRMHDSDARKEGRWFVDDSDRLCILWESKIKPVCFVVTRNEDGTYAMTKKGRQISSILELKEGNVEGL